jgi:hypothetical protein
VEKVSRVISCGMGCEEAVKGRSERRDMRSRRGDVKD